MIVSIIISIMLALLVVFLLYKLNQRTNERDEMVKQEKRSWYLKVALEQACQLPTVESEEVGKIEKQLEALMANAKNDPAVEDKIRELIMSLYEEKVGHAKAAQKPAAKEAPKQNRQPPITGRPGR
jgi:hypothetical protein